MASAMRHEAIITIQSPRPTTVGRLRVDPLTIGGEGGGLVPLLVVPLQAHLFQDENGPLVLVRLEATLWTAGVDRGGVELAPPATVYGIGGDRGLVVARPQSFSPDLVTLRFGLSPGAIRELHDRARTTAPAAVTFDLRFQATLARLLDTDAADTGAAFNSPVAAGLAPYWQTRVEDMQIELSRERWADTVSPGLGEDRLRLVVVGFPPAGGPLGGQVADLFDAARRAYDAGDYRECVQKCRDVRNHVEQSLRSTDDERVAAAVARHVGAAGDDPRVAFLDRAWTAVGDFTSGSHHVHTVGRLDGPSARAALVITATLIELVSELVAPT
jgi:hypothetical protein